MSWFHVSDLNLGPAIKLYPRVPLRRGPNEDAKIARICVSASVAACLRMVAWNDGVDCFHVYELTTDPVKAGLDRESPCRLVPDVGRSIRHAEAWLTKASTFKKIGTVMMVRHLLVTDRPCFFWNQKSNPDVFYDGEMNDQEVKNFHAYQDAVDQAGREMEAEIRAKGGKMASDFFTQR